MQDFISMVPQEITYQISYIKSPDAGGYADMQANINIA